MTDHHLRAMLGHLTATLLLAGAAATSASATIAAEAPDLPGMCNGRSDADVVLTAHTVGADAKRSRKLIVNLETDADGHPTGVLVSGSGTDRLEVVDWCRLWTHRPGDVPEGDGHDGDLPDDSATIVHAVGTMVADDGSRVLVRFDARGTEDGDVYRVRYRTMGAHDDIPDDATHDDGTHDDSSHGDDGHESAWTFIPAQRWAPLTQLRRSDS
jgi:hypothetical protein